MATPKKGAARKSGSAKASTARSWWGRPHADAQSSIDRTNIVFRLPEDTALFASPCSRKVLREKFEWLRQNFGIVSEIVAGIARHAVGKGISMQMNTPDLRWNAECEAQVEAWALTPSRCDAAGRRNFYEAQNFAVQQFVGPGEFFCRDTIGENGEPSFQIYDANEIQSPKGKLDQNILDGVRVDDHYVPTHYYAREGSDFVATPAEEWVHWFDATTANQVRGLTKFAPAVAPLVDIFELRRLTTRSAKAQMLVTMMLKGFDKKKSKGALGNIRNFGASEAGYDGTEDNAALEQMYTGAGGGIAYVDKDGDAKLLTSTAPSPLMEPYITDLLLRDVSLAPGVPVEFFWSPDKLSGSNQRFILEKAALFFRLLADALIYRWIKRQCFRVISWRIATKKLRNTKANWREMMTFQLPKDISIDRGRDSKAQLERLASGATTLRDIYDEQGESYRVKNQQWFREIEEAVAIVETMKVPRAVKDRLIANMPVWRAHASGAGTVKPADQQTQQSDNQSGQ